MLYIGLSRLIRINVINDAMGVKVCLVYTNISRAVNTFRALNDLLCFSNTLEPSVIWDASVLIMTPL